MHRNRHRRMKNVIPTAIPTLIPAFAPTESPLDVAPGAVLGIALLEAEIAGDWTEPEGPRENHGLKW